MISIEKQFAPRYAGGFISNGEWSLRSVPAGTAMNTEEECQ
jgi:hypothetical protein